MFRRQDASAGAEHQPHISARAANPTFTRFASPVYVIDPGLQSNLHPDARPASIPQPRISMDEAVLMHSSNRASPRIENTALPASVWTGFKPTDRSLPSRDVKGDTITDAFVQFVLYCNPSFGLDTDTTTLASTFSSPPKSDSKDFETFRLFELIKKFDAKEIKTWTQLALELGVEAPDTSKGQSAQKVQQYSVRLKRWMRAMHIDAFFEYLLGNQHAYFTEIPPPSDPYPQGGRDGVLAEEDLAIRALDPAFRPKRGRRRNSETEMEDGAELTSAHPQPKQSDNAPRLQSAAPLSAVPMSAIPDKYNEPWTAASAVGTQSLTPWSSRPSAAPYSAATTSMLTPLRWLIDGKTQTPSSPHPMSSISAHINSSFEDEPRSAVTPSSRKRRRHGPAVSSAWPSANAPGAKPRGRPPANRNAQNGPFNTFPADPANERNAPHSLASAAESAEEQANHDQPLPSMEPRSRTATSETNGRPGRLSLQVPPHIGAPVRLASPPRVTVSGETNEGRNYMAESATVESAPPLTGRPGGRFRTIGDFRVHVPDRAMPGFAFEVLRRVLASDLLRAELVGRPRRLTGEEAKRLADAMLERLGVPIGDTNEPKDDISRLTAASWLGVGDQLNVPLGPAVGRGKKVTVTRFRTNADGYEEIANEGADDEDIREVYDVYWSVTQGGCMGNFEMKSLILSEGNIATESLHDLLIRKGKEAANNIDKNGWLESSMDEIARTAALQSHPGDDNIDWKARYQALEFTARLASGEVERFRQRVIDAVL